MLANVKLNLVTALYVLSYVSVVNAYQQENEIKPADNIDKRAGAIGNFFRDFTNDIFGNDNLEVNQPSTNGATSTDTFRSINTFYFYSPTDTGRNIKQC